jgi:iron-sulfur cluster assembly protein
MRRSALFREVLRIVAIPTLIEFRHCAGDGATRVISMAYLMARHLRSALGRHLKNTKDSTMIQLTDGALNAVRSAIEGAGQPVEGLRIMVEEGGCAGLKYMMGLVSDVNPNDIVVEREGVKVYVDEPSLQHLSGTIVDFVSGLEGAGFTFDNPLATSKCSCGKSFG